MAAPNQAAALGMVAEVAAKTVGKTKSPRADVMLSRSPNVAMIVPANDVGSRPTQMERVSAKPGSEAGENIAASMNKGEKWRSAPSAENA